MEYLRRNSQIIAELNGGVKLSRGKLIGHSGSTSVIALGAYQSVVLESGLFIALKESKRFRPSIAVERDLALVSVLADAVPDLRQMVPSFMGLLVSDTSAEIGVLVEDFTEGGRYPIWGVHRSEFPSIGVAPQQLREILCGREGTIDDEELENMFFKVETDEGLRYRIGDFDKALSHLGFEERLEMFPREQILADIDQYTVKIDYCL
jgi:hypothetical protein